jgi:hypothetical protein
VAYPFGAQCVQQVSSLPQRSFLPSWWPRRKPRAQALPRFHFGRRNSGRSRVHVEALEPRYLLSADLNPMVVDMLGLDGDDFTLRYDDATQYLQVIDDQTGQIVDQRLLQEVSEVQIVGSEFDDALTIDLANFVLPLDISFAGGGGNDSLSVINGSFLSATHTATALGAGNIGLFDGAANEQISFTDVESIDDQTLANARAFENATGFGQVIRVTDDGVPNDNFIVIDSGGTDAFSAIRLQTPAGQLHVTAGDSGDTIELDDPAVALDIQGGLGSDTLLGLDQDSEWNIDGIDSGTVGVVDFVSVENLVGGAFNDTFIIGNGGGVSGQLAGGDGGDTLNQAADTDGVAVDFATGTASNTGGIADIENIITGAGDDAIANALGAGHSVQGRLIQAPARTL